MVINEQNFCNCVWLNDFSRLYTPNGSTQLSMKTEKRAQIDENRIDEKYVYLKSMLHHTVSGI